jgi:hypothetical protein
VCGCTGTFEEEDPYFVFRPKGIFFIRMHLNGMNYRYQIDSAYASYDDFDYLMKNWDNEVALLHRWCKIVGVSKFKINKPETSKEAIWIMFDEKLELEVPAWSSDDEEAGSGEAEGGKDDEVKGDDEAEDSKGGDGAFV